LGHRVKLTSYSDATEVEDLFASSLVDVAYVDDIGPDGIYISGDDCIDLSSPKDYAWVTSLIEGVLRDHGIVGIRMEAIGDAPNNAIQRTPLRGAADLGR
jgi:hypothetical protein